jgi:hypothetical protein
MDKIKPDYYKLNIKGVSCDIMDIIKAMNLPITLGLALKYFRIKGDTAKKINDLEKAIYCIQREIDYLNNELAVTKDELPF